MTAPTHSTNGDYTWRVELHEDGTVDVWYIGLYAIDYNYTKQYDTFSDIPEWMQHRVAALRMLSPAAAAFSVDGVGLRISEAIYWVVE